jgi:putative tricarboxylic transport membrane protein
LGRLLEDSFMVSMIKSDWDLTVFFQRPVSAVLGVITILLWSGPFIADLSLRCIVNGGGRPRATRLQAKKDRR